MRYTGPVRFVYRGDAEAGVRYQPIARTLVGTLMASSHVPFNSRSVTLSDGVVIHVRVMSQWPTMAGDWAQDTLTAAWQGSFIVEATIFVPEGTAPPRFVQFLQYQFVMGANGVHPYEYIPFEGLEDLGVVLLAGAWAVAVFGIGEQGEVVYAVVPLVSTLSYLQPGEGDEWVGLDPSELGSTDTFTQVSDLLMYNRYEVVHATSNHIQQPDKFSIIHAPWMPKGQMPYNALGACYGGARQVGVNDTYSGTGDGSGGNPVNNHGTPQFMYSGLSSSDSGYEVPLNIASTPEAAELTPQKSTYNGGVPDADWYGTYARQVVELPLGGEREYGVLIDAAQRLYVWPTETEGTASPVGSPYQNQAIKTSVAEEFVQSLQLAFPTGVAISDLSYRDTVFAEGGNDLLIDESTRYIWSVNAQGNKFAVVAVEYPPLPAGFAFGFGNVTSPLTFGPNHYYGVSSAPYKLPKPRVLEFELEIVPGFGGVDDFTISVTPMTTPETPDNFYPVAADYAIEGAYSEVDADELVIAGFRGHVMDAELAEVRTRDDFSSPLVLNQYVYTIAEQSRGPTDFVLSPETTRYTCPYLVYERRNVSLLDDEWNFAIYPQLFRKFTYESYFQVLHGERVVFQKTVKRVENGTEMTIHTAQVQAQDVKTGSFVFGLATAVNDVTVRGHALFYKSQQRSYSGTGTDFLDHELEGAELPVGYENYAMLGIQGFLTNVLTAPYATDYLQDVATEFGVHYTDISRVGFNNYPWGLEMYAHMAAHLFPCDRAAQAIVAGPEIFSYYGGYFQETAFTVSPDSNDFVEVPEVAQVAVDSIIVSGNEYTHAQLFEEAFGVPFERNVPVVAQSFYVGQVYRTDINAFQPLYRRYFMFGDADWAVNMESPVTRIYNGGMPFPTALGSIAVPSGDFDYGKAGFLMPSFVARAYGHMEL